MKKRKLLLFLILICITLFTVTGCFGNNKKSITTEEFETKLKKKNFIINDVKATQFSDVPEISKGVIAIDETNNYQIEFYECTSTESAKTMYERNKQIFESDKGNNSAYTNVDLNDYQKYTLTTSDKYKVLTRINNTLIYINADKKYKNNIKKILKEINY